MAITFKSVLASSGTSLTIQITTSSTVLYGQTITISKGGSTVGTTAFDNTGNAEYTVRETGTYTVSVTYSGTTFSNTVEVTDTFDTEIYATPDGSTVTPVNDIQIWLHCGNVWNKNYTTLSEVLADTTTLLALINSQNAVDYMVRSHDWCDDVCADATAMTYIGANNYAADTLLADDNPGLVPVMTSNTTPSGVASASTAYSGSYAYKAFDNDGSTFWVASSNAFPQWLEYQFTSAMKPTVCKVKGCSGSTLVHQTVKMQGYNGSSWVDVSQEYTMIGQYASGVTPSWEEIELNPTSAYERYRLNVLSNDNSSIYADCAELQFYAKDGSWLESICNSAYFESVLNVKVPTMTSDTAPSGVAFLGGALNTGYHAFRVFDGNNSTEVTGSGTAGNAYVGYDFGASCKIYKVSILLGNYYGRYTNFKIQGSNDGFASDIHDLSSAQTISQSTLYTFDLASTGLYRYNRVIGYSSGACVIYTLQFYGRAAS